MSQQPPTGPTGASDDVPRTPEEAGGEATESFARSPYDDVPDNQPTQEVPAEPAYRQAPDPTRTIYSEASTTDPEPAPGPEEGRRRWMPVVIAAVVLLIAGGVAVTLLLGGDDGDPVAPATLPPTTEVTTAPEEPTEATTAPTEGATEEPTTQEATPEPTEEPTSELREDLDEAVSVDGATFELSEEGFTPADVEGAVEAWQGRYVSGEDQIEMLASYWPDNEAANAHAALLVQGVDGEQVQTGSTYTNDTGTFWAFLIGDGRGRYIWTTDRGHVLQITGTTDQVDRFYASFPL